MLDHENEIKSSIVEKRSGLGINFKWVLILEGIVGATEIGEDCGRKLLPDVSVSRSQAAFEAAVSVDLWQCEPGDPFRKPKSEKRA